ncbi:hypothetical protein CDD83_4066 [Cordyceps sp. RAO-2017]|nr:hypothetical protein CDD83_4066 [Cordyceps sp. RAO-2017]
MTGAEVDSAVDQGVCVISGVNLFLVAYTACFLGKRWDLQCMYVCTAHRVALNQEAGESKPLLVADERRPAHRGLEDQARATDDHGRRWERRGSRQILMRQGLSKSRRSKAEACLCRIRDQSATSMKSEAVEGQAGPTAESRIAYPEGREDLLLPSIRVPAGQDASRPSRPHGGRRISVLEHEPGPAGLGVATTTGDHGNHQWNPLT